MKYNYIVSYAIPSFHATAHLHMERFTTAAAADDDVALGFPKASYSVALVLLYDCILVPGQKHRRKASSIDIYFNERSFSRNAPSWLTRAHNFPVPGRGSHWSI